MTLQHTPESQNGRLACRILANTALPWKKGKITSKVSTVNSARQKVTSKLRANSRWRVTTPAVDHIRATATIRNTARVWVSTAAGPPLGA